MKINKYTLLGIIFIGIAILLFFSDTLASFIRPITGIFLMGSSKGKDILFFAILGIFLILSQSSFLNKKLFSLNNSYYLKLSIISSLIIAIFGLIIEIAMRYYLGIGQFTIFVTMIPDATTTSILHSHVYKSVVGNILNVFIPNIYQTISIFVPISTITSIPISIPLGIHTGDSLSPYVPKIANIIIIAIPILFAMQVASLKDRLYPTKIILIFSSTCGLIGIIDGGFFSVPFIIGLFGMLYVYFDEYPINYYLGRTWQVLKNRSIGFQIEDVETNYLMKNTREKVAIIHKQAIISYVTFKRIIPYIAVILIILLRIWISLIGTNTEYYELEVINPISELDSKFEKYNILSINETQGKDQNKTLILISPEYNEMELLNNLTKTLNNSCTSYSLSWNVYSYINENNTNITS
ncbi:MAG: hypothetical protein LBM26_03345 [Methanobrevibacter sp.]|jgi:hypothetical protein|nr:hypothetical protein [Methanobrevibacter sp.]